MTSPSTPSDKPTAPQATSERHDLIGSDRVQGTRVYRRSGEKIGQIERVMIDKHTGQVAYAVMNFGGFLGLGEDSYPLPWSMLAYDRTLGGYAIDVSDEQLKNAPKYVKDENLDLGNRNPDEAMYRYWGMPF